MAALGIIAIAALWPLRLTSEYALDEDREDAETAPAAGGWRGTAGISIAVPEESLRLITRTFPGSLVRLMGDLRVDGLEPDVVVDVVKGRGALRFPKEGEVFGERNLWAAHMFVGPLPLADETSRRNVERVVGTRLFGRALPLRNGLYLGSLEQGVYERHHDSPAGYEADLVLDAYRVTAAAAMPLRAGASGRASGVETTIVGIRRESERWVIDLREAAPRVVLPGESTRIVRIVRNRKRGESIVLWGNSRRVPPSALAATAIIAGRTAAVPDLPPSQKDVPLDAAWFADAELVLVSFQRLARFTRHVSIPNLALPAVPVAPEGGKAGGGGR